MIRNYVTATEFYADHSIEPFCSLEKLPFKLSAAERELREYLRMHDTLSRQLQIPQMLVGDYKTPSEVSSDANGDSKQIKGTRFVCEVLTDDTMATFSLEGSEDGTTWRGVYDRITGRQITIEPTGAGIYSAPFAESYPYYRYTVTTDAAVSFYCYLVDGSVDLLIEYKCLELIYQDSLGDDRVDMKHDNAKNKFNELIKNFRAAVDTDGDGAVDTEEQEARPVNKAFR